MSHQDSHGRTSLPFNFQALKDAFLWLLETSDLSAIRFRDDCTWSPLGLTFAALLWSWSGEKPLKHRFFQARKICFKALGRLALGTGTDKKAKDKKAKDKKAKDKKAKDKKAKDKKAKDKKPAESYQAFMKLLRARTPRLVLELMVVLRRRMRAALVRRILIAHFEVFAVDGSRLALPRTESNESRFSPRSTQKKTRRGKGAKRRKSAARPGSADRSRAKKANSPQMWLTILWHVATGLPWDWRTGPSDSSERDHFRQMIAGLPKAALATGDAGFVGYDCWKEVIESGRQLLVRVGSNVRLLRKLGYAREKQGLVYLWPDSAAAKRLPPLVLRLVVVHDGKKPWYLVTSVLDEKRLSNKQVAEIYRLRWGIEVFYRHFKQTFERHKLRSKSAENAQVEAEWSLLGIGTMGLYAQSVLVPEGIPVRRISVAEVLRAYRKAMNEYKSRPDPGESLTESLLGAVIDNYQRASKTSRDYPRKKHEPAIGPPKVSQATEKQIILAKQIKGELALGLTA
jgi:Transposase DDE domain